MSKFGKGELLSIFGACATGLSIILGLGIVQVDNSSKIILSRKYLIYFPYVLFGLLFLSSCIALVILIFERKKKLEELNHLQEEYKNLYQECIQLKEEKSILSTTQDTPLFIKDIPISGILANIEYRKNNHRVNHVKLDRYEIYCRILGDELLRKDADVRYYLKGKNTSRDPLTGLYLSISGDNLVPFNSLDIQYFNLHIDKERKKQLKIKVETDSTRKDLFLPFVTPGIEPFDVFEVELTYRWPRIFATTKDYWFIDNIDFEESTQQICVILEFVDMNVECVEIYSINISTKIPYYLGILHPDPNNLSKYTYIKDNPAKDTYYILLYECK